MPSIRIPFPGFYNSLFDSELDNIKEREAEWLATDSGHDYAQKLEASEYAELLWMHTAHSTAYQHIAQEYVTYFNEYAKERYGIDLGLEFEEMTSPREYNFETDKIFCKIKEEAVLIMFPEIGEDKLQGVIEDNLKSRSGFISFYSDFVRDWKDTPVSEWDYNELYMLLLALVSEDDEYDLSIYYEMGENNVFDTAHDIAVDWKAFEEAVNDKIQEKEEEHSSSEI